MKTSRPNSLDSVSSSALLPEEALGTLATPVSSAELADRRRTSWSWLMNTMAERPLPAVPLWNRLLQAASALLDDLAAIQVSRGPGIVLERPALAYAREGAVAPQRITVADDLREGDRIKLTLTLPMAGALVVFQREGDALTLVYPPGLAYAVRREAGAKVVLPGRVEGKPGDEQELAILVVEPELAASLVGLSSEEAVARLEALPNLSLRSYRWRLGGASPS